MDIALITLCYGFVGLSSGDAKTPMNSLGFFQDKSELNAALGIVGTKVIRVARDRPNENKIARKRAPSWYPVDFATGSFVTLGRAVFCFCFY